MTKGDERPTETVSSLGKHQSCQLLRHNGELQQPHVAALNADFQTVPNRPVLHDNERQEENQLATDDQRREQEEES